MKTKPTLELFEANVKGEITEVSYAIYDGDNESNITQQLNTGWIHDFIEDEGLNRREFINSTSTDIEVDYISAHTALLENTRTIVEQYLTNRLS